MGFCESGDFQGYAFAIIEVVFYVYEAGYQCEGYCDVSDELGMT